MKIESALSRKLPVAAMLAAGLGLNVAAAAEPAKTDSGAVLQEVVISSKFYKPEDSTSSTKFSVPIFDTPQAVSVITSDTLDKFQVSSTDDIYRFVGGLSPQADLPTEATPIISRGFELSGLYGYKLNDVSSYRLFPIDVVAIDRVEAVKGPSGVIFGRNDYGGVLNVKTKRPLQTPQQSVSFAVGSYGERRVEVDVSQPIGTGRLRVRVPAAWEQSNDITGGRDRSLRAVAPSLSFSIDEDTNLDLFAVLQSTSDNFPIGFPGYAPGLTAPSGSCRGASSRCTAPPDELRDFHSALPWNKIETDGSIVVGSLSRRVFDDATLRVAAGYSETESLWRQSYLYGSIAANGNANMYGDRVHFEETGKTAEIGLSGNHDLFGLSHTYYIGADWASDRIYVEDTDDPFLGIINVFDPYANVPPSAQFVDALFPMPNFQFNALDHRNADYLGLGAQALTKLTERLSALVGVRWEKSENFRSRERPVFTNNGGPVLGGRGGAILDNQTNRKFIPRVGLIWALSPNVLNAYVNYSQGYKPQASVTRSGDFIDPEEGRQWEVGLKSQLFDNRFAVSLAAYDIKRDNVAVRDPANTPSESFVVPGLMQHHRGIELEAVGEPVPGLNIIAQTSYIHARAESSLPARLADGTIVNRPPSFTPDSVPKTTAGLFALYQFRSGALQGFSLGAGASYVGAVWVNSTNTFELPGFTTADVSVSYRTTDWEFSLIGKNLFDEAYVTGSGNAEYNLQFGASRTVIGKFRYFLEH